MPQVMNPDSGQSCLLKYFQPLLVEVANVDCAIAGTGGGSSSRTAMYP